VGARNAQAISKVCIAALGLFSSGAADTPRIEDVRIALGSVAPIPFRLIETEKTIQGRIIDRGLLTLAKQIAGREIRPIDDIRSTARYRAAVAGNLIVEFLERLRATGEQAGEPGAIV
jgi:putative cofactor-binding repeat protein